MPISVSPLPPTIQRPPPHQHESLLASHNDNNRKPSGDQSFGPPAASLEACLCSRAVSFLDRWARAHNSRAPTVHLVPRSAPRLRMRWKLCSGPIVSCGQHASAHIHAQRDRQRGLAMKAGRRSTGPASGQLAPDCRVNGVPARELRRKRRVVLSPSSVPATVGRPDLEAGPTPNSFTSELFSPRHKQAAINNNQREQEKQKEKETAAQRGPRKH